MTRTGSSSGDTVPYSNTLSEPVKGTIDYATLDLGYDFCRGAGYKLGAFVGYNFYKENKCVYGCSQIANPLSDCVPAIPSSVLVISEDGIWKSARIGASGEVMIADRFKLGAYVAYLPYVTFNGTDNHVLRDLRSPESGMGRGAARRHSLLLGHRPVLLRRWRALLGDVNSEGRHYGIWRRSLSLPDAAGQDRSLRSLRPGRLSVRCAADVRLGLL